MTYDILGDNFLIQHLLFNLTYTDYAEPEARVAATEASRSCLWMSMDLISNGGHLVTLIWKVSSDGIDGINHLFAAMGATLLSSMLLMSVVLDTSVACSWFLQAGQAVEAAEQVGTMT